MPKDEYILLSAWAVFLKAESVYLETLFPGMALAHSRRPSMAGGFRGVRRESHRVIRSAANKYHLPVGRCGYEPSPNTWQYVPDNANQKVETIYEDVLRF